jgi:DNA-directed RNA polymerase subunit L
MTIKITAGFSGKTIEFKFDENSTFKDLKEEYAKKYAEEIEKVKDANKIKKAIFEAEFKLQLMLGTEIPDDDTTLKKLLKDAVLKDEVIITAINRIRPKPITDRLIDIKEIDSTLSPLDKLAKIAEILSKVIDTEAGTPILANSNKDIVLAAVKKKGLALQRASEDLRKNRYVVLAAVKQDGRALHFAKEDLRKDRDIVLAAVKQDGRALQFAQEDLRKD